MAVPYKPKISGGQDAASGERFSPTCNTTVKVNTIPTGKSCVEVAERAMKVHAQRRADEAEYQRLKAEQRQQQKQQPKRWLSNEEVGT